MFDRVEICVVGGNGGNGVVSFRREKFVPFGGPDGGDGGKGGDVIIRADSNVDDFRRLENKGIYRAGNGKHGKGKKKHGKDGEILVFLVPVGTRISRETEDGIALVADLEQEGQQVVAAKGGEGGRGNARYASSTNQAPRIAQKGESGEKSSIILELRLISDAGIIGHPNAGKSTLLTAASAARPRIAAYPFTTREPVLGTVTVEEESFVLAEIPGLIEGAHAGKGLGHEFLRHILRTRLLIHLVDGSSPSPVENMLQVNRELTLFDPLLAQKPQLVAVNKIDLPEVKERISELKKDFQLAGVHPFFVSAETGEGVPQLMAETMKLIKQVKTEFQPVVEVTEKAEKVFRPQPRQPRFTVHKEGDTFVIVSPELERLVAMSDTTNPEVRRQLTQRSIRIGIYKALEKAGIKQGEKVRCSDLEWEW